MFESHITVKDYPQEEFIQICKAAGTKPLVIVGDSGANFLNQMMTARFHRTDALEIALEEMHKIVKRFNRNKIVRRKLEVIGFWDGPVLYHELHSKFEVPFDKRDLFSYTVESHGGHRSANGLKGSEFMFATSRDVQKHMLLLSDLKSEGFRLVNTIREQVIYDDNPTIDVNWICKGCAIKKYKQEE